MSEKSISYLDHLEELRWRILISLLAIIIVTSEALIFSNTILKVLLIPAGGMKLKAFSLMDGFMIKLRIAMYIDIAVTFPIWGFRDLPVYSPGVARSRTQDSSARAVDILLPVCARWSFRVLPAE